MSKIEIWEISQMPEYLGNFPNDWVSEKFSKYLHTAIWGRYIFKILEISQMTGNLKDTQAFGKFSRFLWVFEGGIFLRFW